ncbi:LysR family transcriptional regulator [Kistimonas scapharcae]
MMTRLMYFNAVVETGSFSEAGRVLDVQPSSVSRQVTALEKELGIALLNRTTRSIGLTEAGRQYYGYSRHVLQELEEARRAVHALSDTPRGRLRLSMTVGFGESVVLPLIPAFMARYPDIAVDIELTERVVDLVDENIDVALRSGRLPDSSLIATKVADNDFLLCATPAFLAQQGQPSTPDELTAFQCIRYGYAGWREWYLFDEQPARLPIQGSLTVNTVQGQKQLVLNHGGIALIPRWAVEDELSRGELVPLLPSHRFSPQENLSATYAIYLNRTLVSGKVRAFLDFLRASLA